jgi:hypothetical protein
MPRGSKPGERRGGRQRGTPNKKTALRNAAISAAAASPNISPLDFLLGLMRDPNLPLEYRAKVAVTALPFVHAKATKSEDDRASTKYGHNRAGNAGRHGFLKAPPRVRTRMAAGRPAADGSPLAFLMGVMRDADAPPGLRIQVARAITPYVHGKLGTAPAEVVVDDEYGFVIDPVAAREIRDHYVEMDRLICTGKFLGTEAEHKFRDRVAEKKKALAVECPTGYTALEAREDKKRIESLHRKRAWHRPFKLTAEENAEEAHLFARLAAYEATPEAQTRERISKLSSVTQYPGGKLSADGRSELDSLMARYPDLPKDPDNRLPVMAYTIGGE